jgi:MFS family permease
MTSSLAVVDAYNVSLWLHITAVMVGFGSTFALSVATPIAMKLDPRHLPYVHQLSINLNRFFAGPALLVVLVTGFYQVSKDNWGYDFWVIATLVIVVILGGLMGAVFLPTAKALKEISEREIAAAGDGPYTPSAEYNRRMRPEMIAGPITGLLLVAAVFLMVTKLGA